MQTRAQDDIVVAAPVAGSPHLGNVDFLGSKSDGVESIALGRDGPNPAFVLELVIDPTQRPFSAFVDLLGC